MSHSNASLPPSLTARPAWKALRAHYERIANVHLRTLFADDPGRGENKPIRAMLYQAQCNDHPIHERADAAPVQPNAGRIVPPAPPV